MFTKTPLQFKQGIWMGLRQFLLRVDSVMSCKVCPTLFANNHNFPIFGRTGIRNTETNIHVSERSNKIGAMTLIQDGLLLQDSFTQVLEIWCDVSGVVSGSRIGPRPTIPGTSISNCHVTVDSQHQHFLQRTCMLTRNRLK